MKRKITAVAMMLMFAFSFLGPVGMTNVAQAAIGYDVIKAPSVSGSAGDINLGIVKFSFDAVELLDGEMFTMSLPSDIDFGSEIEVVDKVGGADGSVEGVQLVCGEGFEIGDFANSYFVISGANTVDIKVDTVEDNGEGAFYIYFNNVDMQNFNGDVTVDIIAPSNSIFKTTLGLIIAKSSSSGNVLTTVKSVKSISGNGGELDIITLMEDSPGTIDVDGSLEIDILTKGFFFEPVSGPVYGKLVYGWAFDALSDQNINVTDTGNDISSDDRTITVSYDTDLATSAPYSDSGRITIAGLTLGVDDSRAKAGDEVKVKISGDGIDDVTLVVAKYVDYEVEVTAGTTTTLIAGHSDQELGTFYIEEGAKGSLLEGRSINLTLPKGLTWKDGSGIYNASNYKLYNNTNLALTGWTVTSSDRTLKVTVDTDSLNSQKAAKIEFKDLEIDVAPNFSGDVTIEVGGNAGAEGTVKVAEVVPAVKLTAENVQKVIVGRQNQQIADIILTESIEEGLLEGEVVLLLDEGYDFSKLPKIEVISGDIEVGKPSISRNNELIFEVETQSNEASAIKITEVFVDVYRYAPEGTVKVELEEGINALNETENDDVSAGEVVVAECITPAEEPVAQATSSQFKIASNIYYVNGIAKIMDASPYIKDSRTYVPVRFLGYALGLTDENILWDPATNKATLTKGETTVELTIGSNSMTVNGESYTMDVAPEISNSRTMLPARFVAEAFSGIVGWDEGTQTVLIELQ